MGQPAIKVNAGLLLAALLAIGLVVAATAASELWLPLVGFDSPDARRANVPRAAASDNDDAEAAQAEAERRRMARQAAQAAQAADAADAEEAARRKAAQEQADDAARHAKEAAGKGAGTPAGNPQPGPGAKPGEVPGEKPAEPAPEPVAVETVEGQQFNPNLRGGLDEASPARIRGWVMDKFEPQTALFVVVFVDEAEVYEFRADKREEHKTLGTIWRFEKPAPEHLQDGQKHTVRAYVFRPDQHGRTELGGSPRAVNQGSIARGKLEEASPEKGISGYAWDPDSGKTPVKVKVTIDGVPVATLEAKGKNEELAKRKITPTDTCAFKLAWPAVLDDGLEHTVQVFAIDNELGTEHEIEGSPRVVSNRSGVANNPPIGAFDICNKVVIAGWAWDPDAGQGSIDVEIWIDGEMFVQVAANSKRDQLKSSKVTPDPYHGWVLTTPGKLLDGNTHTVRAYALNYPAGVKVELQGSPKQYRVEENTTPMGGYWYAAEDSLRGWAADPDLGTAPCEVEVYIDGKFWQKFKADRKEEWLVGSGFAPNAEHGFYIKPPDFVKDGKEHTVQIFAINFPEGPPANLGTRTIGVNSIFPGFWTQDKLIDTRIEKGLYVHAVSPWFDAYHKGVKVGDVLIEYGGIVAGTAEVKDKDGKVTTPGTMTSDFKTWCNTKKPNDTVRFKFWRNGETYEVDVKVGELKGQ
ncbi:MAG: hypothetical protein KF754_06570 [Planctomycetes bacterium]|nr:hypothetical protein [Planctomycetota bacterium]